jgi:hypothetical protein
MLWLTLVLLSRKNHIQLEIKKDFNKTENAFSPLPARTKASNADMAAPVCHYKTALFRLQGQEISAATLMSR